LLLDIKAAKSVTGVVPLAHVQRDNQELIMTKSRTATSSSKQKLQPIVKAKSKLTSPARKAEKAHLPATGSKQSQVVALLQRDNGATLTDLMNATGWQAHSVRGVISGVLKKRLGLNVQHGTRGDGIRYYRIFA
jgi:ATP phosphoribosyltransferase